MNINKMYSVVLAINIFYSVVLVNIAIIILFFANILNIPYNTGITLVIIYFTSELLLFFNDKTTIGIFILSLILAVPYFLIKHIKFNAVTEQIKINLFKLPCIS